MDFSKYGYDHISFTKMYTTDSILSFFVGVGRGELIKDLRSYAIRT